MLARPARLSAILPRAASAQRSEAQAFGALLRSLRSSRGIDLRGYRLPSLMRRLQRRLQAVGAEGFADYDEYLQAHPEELASLVDILFVHATAFFRDAPAWACLAREVIPGILAAKRAGDPVRVWCAGCATGEEAYTAAIVLCEAMGAGAFVERVQLYATDVDERALAQARLASYAESDVDDMATALRERYFVAGKGRWTFRPDLRRAVRLEHHDVARDPLPAALDLVICRNMLMYFNPQSQARLIRRFHAALGGHGGPGYLFLGRAEMMIGQAELFTPVALRWRIFSRASPPGRGTNDARPDRTPRPREEVE